MRHDPRRHIAWSVPRADRSNARKKSEHIANAKLIAAAPALLAALIGMADLYDTDDGCRTLPQYVAARAAIAKATGEHYEQT